MNNAQRLQLIFDAGSAAGLPVVLHMDRVNITVHDCGEILFDPLLYANWNATVRDALNITVRHRNEDIPNRYAPQSGTVIVACYGAELVHDYVHQAPWQAEHEAIVTMAALIRKSQLARSTT